MITVKDFDEIVLDNPFLTDGNVGYGMRKLFWQFIIRYDPDSLGLIGQSNSTCNYITMENDLTGVIYKLIREDDHIHIEEIFQKKGSARETVTDPKKLAKIESKFGDLKNLVRKQVKNHYATIKNIGESKFKFDLESTQQFLKLLAPVLTLEQQDKIIKTLKRVEKNPMSYFDEPTDTIDTNSKNIVQSLFFKVLVDQLEKSGTLIIVDWKSLYEEVIGLLIPLFEKMEIPFHEQMKKGNDYETTKYLSSINDIVAAQNYQTYKLGGVSDTYLLVFAKKQDSIEIAKIAKTIKVELRIWKS